jgi:hypothetical protein
MPTVSRLSLLLASMLLMTIFAASAPAAEPAAAAPAASAIPPEEIDRDGKRIAGYALMTDSERGGYRSQLFFMKTMAERDAFRAEHRKAMQQRAKERGVTLQE